MVDPIREDELRLPQFVGVKIEDLERRSDGAIVRKDRWERGIRSIADQLNLGREWEIDEVVAAVGYLAHRMEGLEK